MGSSFCVGPSTTSAPSSHFNFRVILARFSLVSTTSSPSSCRVILASFSIGTSTTSSLANLCLPLSMIIQYSVRENVVRKETAKFSLTPDFLQNLTNFTISSLEKRAGGDKLRTYLKRALSYNCSVCCRSDRPPEAALRAEVALDMGDDRPLQTARLPLTVRDDRYAWCGSRRFWISP